MTFHLSLGQLYPFLSLGNCTVVLQNYLCPMSCVFCPCFHCTTVSCCMAFTSLPALCLQLLLLYVMCIPHFFMCIFLNSIALFPFFPCTIILWVCISIILWMFILGCSSDYVSLVAIILIFIKISCFLFLHTLRMFMVTFCSCFVYVWLIFCGNNLLSFNAITFGLYDCLFGPLHSHTHVYS